MALIPADGFHVTCDACGDPLGDDIPTPTFAAVREAQDFAAVLDMGWIVCGDGTAVCGSDDDAHRAAVSALMPPEPEALFDGQANPPLISESGL